MNAKDVEQQLLRTWTLKELTKELKEVREYKERLKRGERVYRHLYHDVDALQEAIEAKKKPKRGNLKHEMIKREVNELLKGKPHTEMDEKFRKVATKLEMTFEAVKKAYYYKGK